VVRQIAEGREEGKKETVGLENERRKDGKIQRKT
jgi:hypothetical protein